MSELKLWLLGPPRLEQDGRPIDISRRKAMALLVYLAVTQRDHSREALAALFWPEAESSRARGALRRVLSDLRKLLGEIWLEAEGELVAFDPTDLRLVWGNHGRRDLAFDGRIGREDVLIGRGCLPDDQVQAEQAGRSVFLRLVRQGDQVRASCSQGGRQWLSVGQVLFPAAGPVEVGLLAVGWIDRAIYPGAYPEGTAIRFESFQLWGEKGKDEG